MKEDYYEVWDLAGTGSGYTFPSDTPTEKIDYIFINKDSQLAVKVLNTWIPDSTCTGFVEIDSTVGVEAEAGTMDSAGGCGVAGVVVDAVAVAVAELAGGVPVFFDLEWCFGLTVDSFIKQAKFIAYNISHSFIYLSALISIVQGFMRHKYSDLLDPFNVREVYDQTILSSR
ncbi:hypothetical protein Pelo_4700 [Pelomyxa schiedti]|nr:hypothetical protein Pelo_4700 [Pelomyxa schiedti]